MAYRFLKALTLVSMVASCGGNPFVDPVDPVDPDGGPTGSDGGAIPTEVAKDLNAIRYSASNGGELSVDLTGLISSGQEAEFTRVAAMDLPSAGNGAPGYKAFMYQETGLQRSYLAYVATNARGNLIAASVADGGQFNEHNAGGTFARLDMYTRPVIGSGPEEGLFSYAGTYAGIFVPGPATDASQPASFEPGTPWRVTGDMQINVSFQDNMIEGGVANRVLLDSDGNEITQFIIGEDTLDVALEDLVLREHAIDADGRFLGDVEFAGAPGTPVGNYAGLLGGLSASDIAGVLWLHPIGGQDGIWEYGTFNLPRCDLAGEAPICNPR